MAKKRRTSDKPFKSCTAKTPLTSEPYYFRDLPNPHLNTFAAQHLKTHPYNPQTDNYDPPSFRKPIKTTKATSVYRMHTYWSKKPHDAIRQYITHYTRPGDLVLDPFCGSGGTALAALIEGRKAIAIDRSPAAAFITKNYCRPIDADSFLAAFTAFEEKMAAEIQWLYGTLCDRCGGSAMIAYTIWSRIFRCVRCLKKTPLADCPDTQGLTAKGRMKRIKACPHCLEQNIIEAMRTRGPKTDMIPVMTAYHCLNGCRPALAKRRYNDDNPEKRAFFNKYDLAALEKIKARPIPYWYPRIPMIHGSESGVGKRLAQNNIYNVDDFFTKRNLWALSGLLNAIDSSDHHRDALLFAFTSILLKGSRMMAQSRDGAGRITKGTFYIPHVLHDINVWRYMKKAVSDIARGFRTIDDVAPQVMISTSDARQLDLPDESADYIFTDPPYSDNVQYGELNFIWEAWLNFDTKWHDDEIIVNRDRSRTESEWTVMMLEAMQECHRVLKPGRCLSLCYHDRSEGTWALIQQIMKKAGFVMELTDSAIFIETGQKSYNQLVGNKIIKRDLVINYRKPKADQSCYSAKAPDNWAGRSFSEIVLIIIREYLENVPGSDKDRIYDEAVSRLIHAGRMETHNFEALLKLIACNVPDENGNERWYLRESEFRLADTAETARENNAAAIIREFIRINQIRHPELTGVPFDKLFEYYLYSVNKKPRRPLAEWLSDYFYFTDDGFYRLPRSTAEEQNKANSRHQGLLQRIKRYLSYIENSRTMPAEMQPDNATLAAWIRHCKRAGLYAYGRTLYEKSGFKPDDLSEEIQVNVTEDYETCVRLLARQQSS